MSRRSLSLPLLLCVPLLAACGAEPDEPPPVFQVQAPEGSVRAEFLGAGMVIEHPENWRLRRRQRPAVFELISGAAVIAAWAYPREEPLPEGDGQLEAARQRLLDAIEERDPDYRVLESQPVEVAGAPAIEVTGEQVISKRRLRTRSVHVFDGEVEYVIESLAPPAKRALVERRVLEPLLESLELDGAAGGEAE